MNTPRIVPLVVAFALAAPVNLFAQQQAPVAPGDRVRVTAPTLAPKRLVGTVVEMGADTCLLALEGHAAPVALPLASVTIVEVSRGMKSNVVKGALIGGAVSGGIVLGLGLAAQGDDSGWFEVTAGDVAIATAVFGAVGAVIGGIIGAASSGERWQEVPLDRLRVGVMPAENGLSVGVGVSFRI